MYKSSLSFLNKQNTLLLDEATVHERKNCILRFNTATKDPASPIIVKTEPWEGCGPYVCTTKISASENGYRMYYAAWENTTNLYRMGVAKSRDGLNWYKRKIFEREYNGEKIKVGIDVTDSPHVCWPGIASTYDPRPDTPTDRRYCGLRFTYQGTYAYFSADGYTWRMYGKSPVWKGTSDSIFCIWDEKREKFVAYYKLWRVRGKTAGETNGNIDMLFTSFNERKISETVTELKGPRVTHDTNGNENVEETTLYLQSGSEASDDGGGGHLTGKWNSVRVMCRAESEDFIHWNKSKVVMEADEKDRESANIQIITVFSMGGYYLAFVAIHDQRGFFEQQLAFSTDGINWKRPWRGNLVSRGASGEFDSGMIVNK